MFNFLLERNSISSSFYIYFLIFTGASRRIRKCNVSDTSTLKLYIYLLQFLTLTGSEISSRIVIYWLMVKTAVEVTVFKSCIHVTTRHSLELLHTWNQNIIQYTMH